MEKTADPVATIERRQPTTVFFAHYAGDWLRLQVCFRQRNSSTWMTQVSCFKPNASIWPTVSSVTDSQLRLQDSVEKQNSILLRLRRGKRACS